jgi:hypothetical protein
MKRWKPGDAITAKKLNAMQQQRRQKKSERRKIFLIFPNNTGVKSKYRNYININYEIYVCSIEYSSYISTEFFSEAKIQILG